MLDDQGPLRRWLLELADEGLLTTDVNLVITNCNHWIETHSGRLAADLKSQPLFSAFPELELRGLDHYYRVALSGQVTVLAQALHGCLLDLPAPPGQTAFTRMQQSARIAPLVDDNGNVVGTVTVIEDVTERVAGEDELRRQVHALEAAAIALAESEARQAALAAENERLYREARDAVRAREQFLSIASHELRTPITVIQGYVQGLVRLVDRKLTDGTGMSDSVVLERSRLNNTLARIDRATRRLGILVRQLLDLSRLLQDRVEIVSERIDLASLLAGVTDGLAAPRGEDSGYPPGVRVALELPPEGVWGQWDPGQIEQVLVNLLDNAMKYSLPGGRVYVSLRREPGASDGAAGAGPHAHVVVRDEGIGIPPEEQSSLFQPFTRASNATSSALFGLGLGLAISQTIVARHRGRIWAESSGPNQGSTFHVMLPCE